LKIFIILRNIGIVFAILLFLLFVAAFLFLRFYKGVGKPPSKSMQAEYAERAENFRDGKFFNIETYTASPGRFKRSDNQTRPDDDLPVLKPDFFSPVEPDDVKITWLGHSSVFIQMDGLNILIDPILNTMASPVSFTGVRRFSKVPVTPDEMPFIDVLLISHDHYDHLDYKTIMGLNEKVGQYIVPLGVESYLLGWGINAKKIQTLAWWDAVNVQNISFVLTPARHFSSRNPLRANSTLWGGFLLKSENINIYYSGDGGYGKHFKEIYERYGRVDVFLAEAGQYNINWPNSHMNPREVFKASKDIDAVYVIPIHWGAFVLSDHYWFDPPKLLTEYAGESEIIVITPRIGESFLFNEINKYRERWWE
jgi:L-ascorbate metabolism protein UlaG (beta-lactamase superfamily)